MSSPDSFDRYVRQMQFAPLGREGQERIAQARIFLCGCGALGTVLANTLVRAGVGFLRIVDRDFIEPNNLQRQVLFDEDDIAASLPKAIAAANKLRKINSQVVIEAEVADVDPTNIESYAADVDLILDGTDNFETRFLINDLALKSKRPWVYGGCLGAEGQSLTIIPEETPCLRCLIAEPPPPGESPTCDTAGILSPIINVIASIQACEALKILSGKTEAISRQWTIINLWDNSVRQIDVSGLRESVDCPACDRGEFPWLNGERASQSAVLCGRNAVQVSPPRDAASPQLDLAMLEAKLSPLGDVARNPFLLRADISPYTLTVFADGRAIISGTDEISTAKTVYAKYVGT
ncbi:MAG: ThiF family adenylyltransferase [Pirellulales bacterium]|nr:ThiF family adenylyltransferase [Pirellulales bacterium]